MMAFVHSCGWGSATLYFAEVFPNSTIVGFSNSKTQKECIDGKAKEKGLKNIKVLTGDVVNFDFQPEAYDRILTVEVTHITQVSSMTSWGMLTLVTGRCSST